MLNSSKFACGQFSPSRPAIKQSVVYIHKMPLSVPQLHNVGSKKLSDFKFAHSAKKLFKTRLPME
jgi:hypothetical protein